MESKFYLVTMTTDVGPIHAPIEVAGEATMMPNGLCLAVAAEAERRDVAVTCFSSQPISQVEFNRLIGKPGRCGKLVP